MTTATKVRGSFVSGFCSTPGADGTGHDRCRGTFNNAGGVLACTCGCHDGRSACRDCGRTDIEVGAEDTPRYGQCLDVEGCIEYRQHLRDSHPTSQMIRQIRAEREQKAEGTMNRPKVERQPRPVATAKQCLCGCEGVTKGGNYLAGHDARHLSAIVTEINGGGSLDLLERLPSDALRAKARKRLEVAG